MYRQNPGGQNAPYVQQKETFTPIVFDNTLSEINSLIRNVYQFYKCVTPIDGSPGFVNCEDYLILNERHVFA